MPGDKTRPRWRRGSETSPTSLRSGQSCRREHEYCATGTPRTAKCGRKVRERRQIIGSRRARHRLELGEVSRLHVDEVETWRPTPGSAPPVNSATRFGAYLGDRRQHRQSSAKREQHQRARRRAGPCSRRNPKASDRPISSWQAGQRPHKKPRHTAQQQQRRGGSAAQKPSAITGRGTETAASRPAAQGRSLPQRELPRIRADAAAEPPPGTVPRPIADARPTAASRRQGPP